MLLFRSEEHIDRWCKQWNRPRGGTLSLAQGWKLAQFWYGDRLDPKWHAESAPEVEEEFRRLFARIGVTGDFWRMT
jgi:hypothetical protein